MADYTFLIENVNSVKKMLGNAAYAAELDVTTVGNKPAFHSARGYGLHMLATKTAPFTRRLMKAEHGVDASVRLLFGIQGRYSEDAKDSLLIAVNQIMTDYDGNALLFARSGTVVLWREDKVVYLNTNEQIWDDDREEFIDPPFTRSPM